jgi:hypothetical protein
MALGLIGTVDLSLVTDRLLSLLRACYDASPMWKENGGSVQKFNIAMSGAMPESVRSKGGCQLSLYLLHVRENPTQKNASVMGRTMLVPFQPLALELSYLLTVYSSDDYRQEQRAMSLALRCLYENPIVRMAVPIAGTTVPEEFTLQLQSESPDELGRVWQAISAPLRLSTIFRASVVFITPEAPTTPVPAPVDRVVVSVDPVLVSVTTSIATWFTGTSTVARPRVRTQTFMPAVAGPGDPFSLVGSGLLGAESSRVYLIDAAGVEQEITGWIDPDPLRSSSRELTLRVPAAGGPPAGSYEICVGSDVAAGDASTRRSARAPLALAAKVGPAANPPVLTPNAAGTFTIAGAGFVPGSTDLFLGTVALSPTGIGPPPAGEFAVAPASISFRPPAGMSAGLYNVRVRANDVESVPAWWVRIP